MFEVILSPVAQKFYAKARQPLAGKLARCFEQLERDPKGHNNVKRLTGKLSNYYRYHVGDWRVLFTIHDKPHLVNVLVIAHRSEIYE